jgi:hypothetical protein
MDLPYVDLHVVLVIAIIMIAVVCLIPNAKTE